MIGNKFNNQNGVTLLELLVAMGLFTIIILSAMGVFNIVLESQRNALASQNIQESLRYAMEVMSKEIRMAKPSYGSCLSNGNRIYNQTSPSTLSLLNKDGVCVGYWFVGNRIFVVRGVAGYLTPSNITISNLNFKIIDEAVTLPMTKQPKVTISFDAEMKSGKDQAKQKVHIQTTISSRYYE